MHHYMDVGNYFIEYISQMIHALTFLGYIFRLIIKPQSGWEDVGESGYTREQWLSSGLLPLLSVLAISCFIHAFYGEFVLNIALQDAITSFVSLFASIFVADEVISIYVKQKIATDSEEDLNIIIDKTKIMSIFNIGFFALIFTVRNIVPIENTLFNLLPFCTIFSLASAWEFIGIDKDKHVVLCIVSWLSAYIPAIAISEIFNLLL